MCVGGGWGVWPWSGLWSVQLFVPRTHQHLQHSCRVFGGISSSSSSLFLKRLICGGRPAWRQQADAISTTYMAITPTKTPRAAGTYCTLLCVYCPFHFFFFHLLFSTSHSTRCPQQRHGNTGDECRQRKSRRQENGGGGGGGVNLHRRTRKDLVRLSVTLWGGWW